MITGSLGYWAFDNAVIWACFKAFGESPPITLVLMGYLIGQLGGLLPIPGGIGGIDGGLIGTMIVYGLPAAATAAAVLAYRVILFWLPLVLGGAAFAALRRGLEDPARADLCDPLPGDPRAGAPRPPPEPGSIDRRGCLGAVGAAVVDRPSILRVDPLRSEADRHPAIHGGEAPPLVGSIRRSAVKPRRPGARIEGVRPAPWRAMGPIRIQSAHSPPSEGPSTLMAKLLTIPAGRTAKWIVLAIALVVLFGSFAANLPGEYADAEKNQSTSFLPGDAESTKALEVTKELQGGERPRP